MSSGLAQATIRSGHIDVGGAWNPVDGVAERSTMTSQKHLKRLVRARMERTGESYTTARSHIVDQSPAPVLAEPQVVQAHGRHGQSVVFSPDGEWVISGGQDKAIRFHRASTLEPGPVLEGHERVVTCVTMTSDGDSLLSASSDKTVRLWSHRSGKWAQRELGRHRDTVTVVAVDTNDSHAASSGYDGHIRLWSLNDSEQPLEVPSPIDRVTSLVFLPDGATIAEAGLGGEIILRSTDAMEERSRLDSGAPGVLGMAVSPNGRILAVAEASGALALWDPIEAEELRRIELGGNAQSVAITSDGRFVAASWDRNVAIWSFEDDQPVTAVNLGIKGVYSLAFDPEGRRLALTGADGKVRVWDLYPS